MKILAFIYTSLSGGLLFAQAQPIFNSGSNESYGAMNVVSSTTLQMPPDGVFHCTTVTIASGATLSFAKNALNTPVYILATGDVSVQGTISVKGKVGLGGNNGTGLSGGEGGPGGFPGGLGSSTPGIPAGAGGGPGGGAKGVSDGTNVGNAGNGSYRTVATTYQGTSPIAAAASGATYGNDLLLPLVGGSGGGGLHRPLSGGGGGGGGGGGAILIASNTKIIFRSASSPTNSIDAGGAAGAAVGGGSQYVYAGGGSGGSIRLVAPIISGFCSPDVGGYAPNATPGNGRIRVDTFDTSGLNFPYAGPTSTGTVMVVFPNPMPKLSVANAAGTTVAENTAGSVSVILPTGTSPNQIIQVRARDFGSVVPIRVRLAPDSGDAVTYDASIDNTVSNPATTTVPVTMPINTGVRVEVYTR